MQQNKNLYINPLYEKLDIAHHQKIYDLADIGEIVSNGSDVRVWKRNIEGHSVYVKRYQYKSPSWRFFARKSKAKKELEAYELYKEWQIPHPEVICYAEKRVLARPLWAIIITKGIENSQNLEELFQVTQRDTPMRVAIMQRAGEIAHLLAQKNFKSPTFRMRNVLWQENPQQHPTLFLIDTPSHSTPKRPNFRIQHYNITQLYRDIRVLCSEPEWHALLERYCSLGNCDFKLLQDFVPKECMRRFGKPNMKRYKKLNAII